MCETKVAYSPHFLVRVAGQPVEHLTDLTFSNTLHCVNQIKEVESELKDVTERTTALLYDYIRLEKNQDRKKALINFKRDVYNHRHVTAQTLKKMTQSMPAELKEAIGTWHSLLNDCVRLNETVQDVFERELVEKRHRLRQLFSEERFIKGIQLSNEMLYRQLNNYLRHDWLGDKLTKKLRHAELSLLNYFNRMVFKPTPFSTFTGLCQGVFTDGPSVIRIRHSHEKRHVNVNLAYIKRIERKVLELEDVRPSLHVSLNPTFRIVNDHILFFRRGKDGTAQAFNDETFVKIKLTSPVKKVIQVIQEKNGPITVHELVHALWKTLKNTYSLEECRGFVEKLESTQLITFSFGIEEQARDYLHQFVCKLKTLSSPKIEDVVSRLEEVHDIVRRFSHADHQKRAYLLAQAERNLNQLYDTLHIPFDKQHHYAKAKVFEDVSYDESRFQLNRDEWTGFLEDLSVLQQFMPLFDDHVVEKIAANQFFRQRFGENRRVKLLDFYREYSRMTQSDWQQMWHEIQQHNDTFQKVKTLRKAFYDYVSDLLDKTPAGRPLYLEKRWIKQLLEKFPDILRNWSSSSFYCQLARNGNATHLVLNKVGPGYGKHYSRYCDLFFDEAGNNSFLQSIRESYKVFGAQTVFADLNAVLGLNINLHPKILDYELTYPGSSPNLETNQINVSDVSVCYDRAKQRLTLYADKLAKSVELIPMGFLFPMLAPPFYKFLSSLSYSNGVEHSFWEKFDRDQRGGAFRYYPRLLFGNVVLDRRTWKIPVEAIRSTFRKSDWEYFCQIQELVDQHRLPSHVFVKALSSLDVFSDADRKADLKSWIEDVKKTRQRKPQYVNFHNYFDTKIMEKIVKDASGDITFQEVYPTPGDALAGEDGHYVSEFLFEVHNPRSDET
jgi:hypothetical protein